MKKILFLLSSFMIINEVSGQLSNGGFESYSSLPTCPSSFPITKATSWLGLKSSYPSTNCNTVTDVTSTLPDYFNTAAGGTSSCQPAGAAPNTGTGFAHLEYRGFVPASTASAEYIYQSVAVTSGMSFSITAYVNTLTAGTDPIYLLGITMVNTSVGSSASAILTDVRSQGTSLTSSTSLGSNWYKVRYDWTAPSTGNYYLVMGCNVFCNDGAYSTLRHFVIDDVSMNCAVDAGPNKLFGCSCCAGGCLGVTIGTTASGSTYSWSPTTGLSCSTCATTTALPTAPTTTYTLTVSGTGCTTATDQVVVTKLYSVDCCPPKMLQQSATADDNTVNIFPNPSENGKYSISIGASEVQGSVHVFDVTGKEVYKNTISVNSFSVDLSSLPKGSYVAQLEFNGKTLVRNIIYK